MMPRVAVMGAGAVGCYFGGMLARAGAPVMLIARQKHVDVINREGLLMDCLTFQERILTQATTEIEAVREAQIVLLTVKTRDTEEVAKALLPHLHPGIIVVSMQNGVDNVERIRAASGIEAIPAVVYVAAAMTAPGTVKHTGRGDLIFGSKTRPDDVDEVAPMFALAGVPCRVSDNIEGDLWVKMILNCAYNAMSALTRAKYGTLMRTLWTREVMERIIEECLAVASGAGVKMPKVNMVEAAVKLGEAMSQAVSSTAQDIAAGRMTEIDSLNGYIVRRGKELGIPVPANQTLHALVKLLELGAN